MLPMSDPAIAEQVEALKRIRQLDRLYVDVQTTVDDQAMLDRAADQMHAALQSLPELSDIRYRFEGTDLGEVLAQLRARLPTLLSSNDLQGLAGRLEAPVLQRRLDWMKQALSQPQGLIFKEVVQTDPVGLADVVAERMRMLQAGVGEARLVGGRITSPDGRHVLMSALPVVRPSDLRRSERLIDGVLKAARETENQFDRGTIQIAVSGAHRATLDNASLIRSDSTWTSLIAAAGVAGMLLAAYRRRRLALLGLVPTAFGLLGVVLVFAVTGQSVAAAALGFGSILIGVTVDYGNYLLYAVEEGLPRSAEQLAQTVRRLAPKILFGALTTMAAFWVMFISPVSGHRQLATCGAVGVALAALFAILILPLFVPLSGAGESRRLPLTSLIERLFVWRQHHRRALAAFGLLFTALCLVGLIRLRFEGDLARLNGVRAETAKDDAVLRAVWGNALSLTTIVVSGADWEEALKQNEQVWSALQRLREEKAIETFSSIAPLFPSEQTRGANLGHWQDFWTAARRQDLSNSLVTAAGRLGFRPSAFQPFLERLQAPVASGFSSSMAQTLLGRLLNDYWKEEGGRVSVSTLVKVRDLPSYLRLRETVLRETPRTLLLHTSGMAHEIARMAKQALPVFGVLVVVLNAFLIFLLLGRLELVFITLFPMATGVFWTLGTLGLLGLPIDISNFIFVIFVVGVGGDYSLFLVSAELEPLRGYPRRTASTGGAVTVSALTTLLGMGCLVLARHPALFSVGLTALLGISFSLLATLILVPACMGRLHQRMVVGTGWAAGAGVDRVSALRRRVRRLYRYQGPYVTQFVFWKTKIDPLFKAVDKVLPARGMILDLGCGYGIVAHWLTHSEPERTVFGVDNDEEKIRVAQASATPNPRVSFASQDVLAWEYPPCDQVLLCDVLHYFPHELKRQMLRKAFQALRPGGQLVLRDACNEQTARHRAVVWAERWAVCTGQNKTAHGLHFESAAAHLELLHQAGFARMEKQDAGLGSNRLIIAWKEETPQGADSLNVER
jgi:predicted exporter/2-polyprenyl-3-methyl-5-hydroxy-6-metoxy-1,4-benzoquinol methylase